MQTAPRPGVVIAFAAIIAACVAAVVGGMTALVVVHFDDISDLGADGPRRETIGPDGRIVLRFENDETRTQAVWTLPEGTVHVRLHATSDHGPIALRASIDESSGASWDAESYESAEEQDLDLSARDFGRRAPGRVVIEVESLREAERNGATEVTVEAEAIASRTEAELQATSAAPCEWTGATSRDSGFIRTVAVRVPAGAEALRIDLADASSDLDLIVRRGSPLPWESKDDEEASAASPATAESLVIDSESKPPLAREGGTYYVTVSDPAQSPFAVSFRLVVTLGRDAPAEFTTVPDLPKPSDPRERALLCVVELMTDEGGGSGTLVSEDGLVLTARHVVEAAARAAAEGRPDDAPEIVVAVTLDAREVAKDMFLAEVVASDRDLDLAMLRIVGGVRDVDLPEGYTFPYVKPRRRSAIYLGETVWTVGYPAAGGSGTRATLTLARGSVGGWTRAAKCNELKTDAFVSPGSSGGAAFDDRWELIGVPVSTQDGGTTGTVLGNVVPVEAVPAAWWR